MKSLAACALLLLATPAVAQIQGGPNIAPNGTRFTYSPRFGYIGPPRALVPYPPPAPTPYGPGSMPTIFYPREPPPAPMAYAPPLLPEPPAPCIVSPYDVELAPLLNVRASPNGWIVGQLLNGTPVFPTDEFAGNWVFITAPVQGWVFRPYLACLPPPPPDTGPPGPPPARFSERPAIPAPAMRPNAPAPRLPGSRKAPNLPCPDGCPREPNDPPMAQ